MRRARALGLVCPKVQGGEAAWAGELDVLAPDHLIQLINHCKGRQILSAPKPQLAEEDARYPDLKDIKGQESAKRALEIAAAGAHNLLMLGPPGSGKSMLAARLPGLLPPLDPAEALETSMIHSLAGHLQDGKLKRRRPFRDPHHSASLPSLVGGGQRAKPGEISLAHLGVLFLDELPEFQRATLEALRQPMEMRPRLDRPRQRARDLSGARAAGGGDEPLPAAAISTTRSRPAAAPRKCAQDYQSRISGPLFDRIDLHIDVPAVSAADLTLPPPAEGSTQVAARVAKARAIQTERYKGSGIRTNAEADGELLEQVAPLDEPSRKLITQAIDRFRLSARGFHRVLRVARTLADLEGGGAVKQIHVAEALTYRRVLPGR